MPRRIGAVVGVVALIVAIAIPVSAAATKKHAYSVALLGAQISQRGNTFQDAYRVTSSLDGSGAAVQVGTITRTISPIRGTSVDTSYYADGVSKTKDTFKIGAPNAAGISTITGTGTCIGGTGIHKHEKCSYKVVGSYNTKTTITRATVAGTTTR